MYAFRTRWIRELKGTVSVFSLALLNGGVGTRVAAGQPKQFLVVKGIPIIVYSLVAADSVDSISQIVLNYPDGWRDDVEKIVIDYAIKTPITYVPPGRTRHESVATMLPHLDNEHVIIHESARPLVTSRRLRADHRARAPGRELHAGHPVHGRAGRSGHSPGNRVAGAQQAAQRAAAAEVPQVDAGRGARVRGAGGRGLHRGRDAVRGRRASTCDSSRARTATSR